MSWTRESLIAAVLALCAPWAMADSITVNTTTDDFASNSLCSLREAVEYFNRGKPSGGFQGCSAELEGNTSLIKVPANAQPYLIANNAITIRSSVYISGDGRKDGTVTTLQVSGVHRAFVVSHNPQYSRPKCAMGMTVTCATDSSALDVDATSDTDAPGDYLTSEVFPTLKGVLPADVVTPPATSLPAYSHVLRLYRIPETGEPVEIGKTKIPFSTSPMPWQILVTTAQDYGVAHFDYKLETVVTATEEVVTAAGPFSGNTVKLAIHPASDIEQVSLAKMVIKGGCATATGCADSVDDNTTVTNETTAAGYDEYALTYSNGLVGTGGRGGVIFNDENLTLSDVWIEGGQATWGGAVFVSAVGSAAVELTDLQSNTADHGAALHAEVNSVHLDMSLLHLNTVSNPAGGGAVFEIASGTVLPTATASRVTNSTISGNNGLALSLVEGSYVNVSTIVDNAGGGVDFNGLDARVYNSILAGNTGGADCQNLPSSPVMSNNLVLAPGSCPTSGNQSIDGVAGGAGQLMATLVDGKCGSAFGILCPLADQGGATFVHLPRVLLSYASDLLGIGASPVINKGFTGTSSQIVSSCPNTDQRGEVRPAGYCDIGAAEFQDLRTGAMELNGDSIRYGQTFTGQLDADLKDEELLPAAECPPAISLVVPAAAPWYPPSSLAPDSTRVVPDSYRPDVPGCPWLERAAARGAVTFEADGSYTYKPYSDFHGFDVFDFRVVSTLSRMNDLPADRSRVGRIRVIVEPAADMVSSKVGGGLDAFLLMGIVLLGLKRRGGRS